MATTKFGKYFTTDVIKESPKFPGLWDVSSTRHLTASAEGTSRSIVFLSLTRS